MGDLEELEAPEEIAKKEAGKTVKKENIIKKNADDDEFDLEELDDPTPATIHTKKQQEEATSNQSEIPNEQNEAEDNNEKQEEQIVSHDENKKETEIDELEELDSP